MARYVIPFIIPILAFTAPAALSQDLGRAVDSHETRITNLENDFRDFASDNESTDVGLENRLTTIETYQRVTLAVIGAIGLAVLGQILAAIGYVIMKVMSHHPKT